MAVIIVAEPDRGFVARYFVTLPSMMLGFVPRRRRRVVRGVDRGGFADRGRRGERDRNNCRASDEPGEDNAQHSLHLGFVYPIG